MKDKNFEIKIEETDRRLKILLEQAESLECLDFNLEEAMENALAVLMSLNGPARMLLYAPYIAMSGYGSLDPIVTVRDLIEGIRAENIFQLLDYASAQKAAELVPETERETVKEIVQLAWAKKRLNEEFETHKSEENLLKQDCAKKLRKAIKMAYNVITKAEENGISDAVLKESILATEETRESMKKVIEFLKELTND